MLPYSTCSPTFGIPGPRPAHPLLLLPHPLGCGGDDVPFQALFYLHAFCEQRRPSPLPVYERLCLSTSLEASAAVVLCPDDDSAAADTIVGRGPRVLSFGCCRSLHPSWPLSPLSLLQLVVCACVDFLWVRALYGSLSFPYLAISVVYP